jgi:hypothetical protein
MGRLLVFLFWRHHRLYSKAQKPIGCLNKFLRAPEHLLVFLSLFFREAGKILALDAADEKDPGYDVLIFQNTV